MGLGFYEANRINGPRFNQKQTIAKLSIDTESIMRKIRSLISGQFLQGITFPLQGDIIIIIFDSENLLPETTKRINNIARTTSL